MCGKPLKFYKCYAMIIVSGRQVIPLLCNNDKKKRMPYFFTSLYSIPAVKLRDVWVMRWLLGLGDLDVLCSGRYEWQETWAACQKRGVSPERTNLKDDSYDSWHNLSPGNAFAATPVAFPAVYCLYWNCNHRCFIIPWFKKKLQTVHVFLCRFHLKSLVLCIKSVRSSFLYAFQ